jgi:hypothetical protein
MIKIINREEISMISEYIWKVYQDDKKRTTPPYEGTESIKKHLIECLKYKDDRILAIYNEDDLEGATLLVVNKKERSINMQGPYIYDSEKYDMHASEITNYLDKNYKGYECYVGTTKTNIRSQLFLSSKGYKCVEDTIQMSLVPSEIIPIKEEYDIRLLSEERKEEYLTYHNEQYKDYFWTAERIYKVVDRWVIHILLKDNRIVGSIFSMKQTNGEGEIYGYKAYEKDSRVLAELIYVNSKYMFEEGMKKILNCVEEGIESESAESVGYKPYDTYMCYYKYKL